MRQDEVQLFGLVSSPYTVVSLSPFVGKVQTFLRMANIPHKIAAGLYDSNAATLHFIVAHSSAIRPHLSPRGKVPWLVHGLHTIADSSFIIDYLIRTYAPGKVWSLLFPA